MGNLKNLLFVTAFMLLGFGVEANTSFITAPASTTINAPQGDGIIHVSQGRHKINVDILVGGLVTLQMANSSGEIVYQHFVNPNKRFVKINTKRYDSGTYTLVAYALVGTETVSFVIDGKG